MVVRTPLDDLGELDLGRLGRDSQALIRDLLTEVDSAAPAALSEHLVARARELTDLRRSSRAAEVPRDLADLQRLVGEALARNGGGDHAGERAGRLALLFGELQAAYLEELLDKRFERDGLDPVTGLAGEDAIRLELDRLIDAASAAGVPLSLLELDVDGLGRINAAHGDQAGDRLLIAIADALRAVVGVPGRVFRRAGDEFAAILEIPGPNSVEIASRLRDSLALLEADHGIPVYVSIGVASWPEHATESGELLERVREATYLAKATGQGVADRERSAVLQRS